MGSDWVLPAESERERALLATAEIWREHGFEGLTRGAISGRAGISAEEFAAVFADVRAVATAAIEVPLAAVVEIVADLYSPDRSEAESYARAIVRILQMMAANPAYAFVVYIGGRQMAPSEVHTVFASGHHLLVAMLERLWGSSTVSEQPARAGVGILGSAEAVVRRELMAGRHDILPALAPDFVYGAITPFLGQAEGLRLARFSRRLVKEAALES
jgi:AcrR family transcriptional regulator